MDSVVRAVLVVWPGKAAVDLIGVKIEFQLPHSTLTKPANPSEFFYIEYKKLKNCVCVVFEAFYSLKLGLYMFL